MPGGECNSEQSRLSLVTCGEADAGSFHTHVHTLTTTVISALKCVSFPKRLGGVPWARNIY